MGQELGEKRLLGTTCSMSVPSSRSMSLGSPPTRSLVSMATDNAAVSEQWEERKSTPRPLGARSPHPFPLMATISRMKSSARRDVTDRATPRSCPGRPRRPPAC